jgi:hypothetical protein
MTRRRSAHPVRSAPVASLAQIALLAFLLAFLLLFRDKISAGASNFFSVVGASPDLKAPPAPQAPEPLDQDK